jgi:hypothetical protein
MLLPAGVVLVACVGAGNGIENKEGPRATKEMTLKRIALACFVLAGLEVGCGGGSANGGTASAPSAPTTAPAETASLTFVVVPGTPGSPTAHAATEALRSALISAGYKVSVDARAAHDAEIVSRVTATPERSLFVVQVNGRSDTKERVHLTATVVMHGQVIDETAAEFLSTNSQVTPQDVGPAVNGLSASPKVAILARQIREQADTREHAKQEKEAQANQRADDDAKKKLRVEEETDWNRARITGCRQPTALTGCDATRTYVAKYPASAHLEEAQTALKTAEPLMEKLQKDENTWMNAGVDGCRTDHTRDTCSGVELYMTKFPAGMHLDEAQGLMRRVQ